MHLASAALSAIETIRHGFGTREEELPTPMRAAWDSSRPRWKQVHGVDAAEVVLAGQDCGEVDALYSRKPGIPIAVMTADCVPILMSRRDGGAVAAIHAGWRGTRAGITQRLWERLRREGEKPSDWVAAVGPSIGPCCYEVSPEIAADFARELGSLEGAFGQASEGSCLAVPRARHLDLPAIQAALLADLGVGEVDLLRLCTRCTHAQGLKPGGPARFLLNSYRREGSGTRQWSAISRRSP